MKILIINGSHRQGNTDLIIDQIIKQLTKNGQTVKELVLRNIGMKLPDGCENCADGLICSNLKDEFSEKIEPTIRNYDVYIIASPTWSDGVTPLTKIFWDRIVSWCHDDRKYLKGKKLAIVTHGMAGKNSWNNVINWVKSVCIWEEAVYGGSLTCQSGGKVGELEINSQGLQKFISTITK